MGKVGNETPILTNPGVRGLFYRFVSERSGIGLAPILHRLWIRGKPVNLKPAYQQANSETILRFVPEARELRETN